MSNRRWPALAVLGCTLLIWWAAARFGVVGRTVLAGPGEVASLIPSHVFRTVLYHFAHSAARALVGWTIALLAGAILGLSVGARRLSFDATQPLVEFFRSVPPVLAFPLFLVSFDYGERAYVWTIVFGCLPIVFLTVARGTQTMDPGPLRTLRVFGASRTVLFAARALEALPALFLAARVTFSISLIVTVVCEMVSTPRSGIGAGTLARDAELSFETPTFYLCIIVVGAYAFLCNRILEAVERRLSGAAVTELRAAFPP
jgi:ABC-type nitrate/sulfonate/bicarbonate transport system permease component